MTLLTFKSYFRRVRTHLICHKDMIFQALFCSVPFLWHFLVCHKPCISRLQKSRSLYSVKSSNAPQSLEVYTRSRVVTRRKLIEAGFLFKAPQNQGEPSTDISGWQSVPLDGCSLAHRHCRHDCCMVTPLKNPGDQIILIVWGCLGLWTSEFQSNMSLWFEIVLGQTLWKK